MGPRELGVIQLDSHYDFIDLVPLHVLVRTDISRLRIQLYSHFYIAV